VLDLLIPTAGYYLLHWAGLSDVWALTIAGSATAVNAAVATIRRRRLDALGLLVVAEVAVSVALAASTGDPRLILARPAVYLAVAGIINLVSCFTGRPLSYTAATPMATKGDPLRAVAYERAWHHSAELRAIHRQLTAGIGLAMVAYAVLRADRLLLLNRHRGAGPGGPRPGVDRSGGGADPAAGAPAAPHRRRRAGSRTQYDQCRRRDSWNPSMTAIAPMMTRLSQGDDQAAVGLSGSRRGVPTTGSEGTGESSIYRYACCRSQRMAIAPQIGGR
jgi:hypothetical protein